MATSGEIVEQIRILADSYGRTLREAAYDGFVIALSDIDAKHLKNAVAGLLRDKTQFMPTPAEVRQAAKQSVEWDFRRDADDESRRLICARCQDRGVLRCFNRRWVAEHRDEFGEAFFCQGWLNVARRWCRENYHEDLFVWVICGCQCLRSEVFQRNRQLWREDPATKKSKPAFVSVHDREHDCIERLLDDPTRSREQDYAAVLTEFHGSDRRKWQGNWTP